MGAVVEWLIYVWDWHLRSQLLHAISHLSFPYIYFLPTATKPCFPHGECPLAFSTFKSHSSYKAQLRAHCSQSHPIQNILHFLWTCREHATQIPFVSKSEWVLSSQVDKTFRQNFKFWRAGNIRYTSLTLKDLAYYVSKWWSCRNNEFVKLPMPGPRSWHQSFVLQLFNGLSI